MNIELTTFQNKENHDSLNVYDDRNRIEIFCELGYFSLIECRQQKKERKSDALLYFFDKIDKYWYYLYCDVVQVKKNDEFKKFIENKKIERYIKDNILFYSIKQKTIWEAKVFNYENRDINIFGPTVMGKIKLKKID